MFNVDPITIHVYLHQCLNHGVLDDHNAYRDHNACRGHDASGRHDINNPPIVSLKQYRLIFVMFY